MAVIGRIRKRVGLLIGFVGVSMLLFILGDLVTSNTGIMHRNSDVMGAVESMVNDTLQNYLEENPKAAKTLVSKVMLAAEARHAARKARHVIIGRHITIRMLNFDAIAIARFTA